MTVLKKEKTAAVLKKQLPQKSNCCVEVVTLKKGEEVASTKIKLSWKSGNMLEGKSLFEKKETKLDYRLRSIFHKRFLHP